MSQLNIHLNAEFENALGEYMRLRELKTKSEAVRQAVLEAVERERRKNQMADFSQWRGLALRAPMNQKPRFQSDDDLWS